MSEFPYEYEFPVPIPNTAPIPSTADYSQENVAWLIEFLGPIAGYPIEEITLKYDNNDPENSENDIFVTHPDPSRDYLSEEKQKRHAGSINAEMERYEKFAKTSQKLQTFMETSPANITYFL